MKTYTTALGLLRSITKIGTSDTVNDALLTSFYNDSIRTQCNIRGGKWWFLETTRTLTTVSGQRAYSTPQRIRKINDLYVTSGSTIYRPNPVYDSTEWSRLLSSELADDDRTLYYFVQGNKVNLYPSPSTSGLTVTVTGRINVQDQGIADYTVGTITSIANGATAVVGSGTTWTTSMAGNYIRITDSDTALKGDGFWYEIASVESATTLTLVAPYEGTSIAAGAAAYTIGQVSPIPEAYDMGPIYRSLAIWYTMNDPVHPNVAGQFWRLYDGGQEAGMSNIPGGLVGQMLENEGAVIEDVYLSPNHRDNVDPNYPPRDASGFT